MMCQQAGGVVSVIIPTFRRPREVRAAVESALAQTWRDLEVIVVSDGPDAEARAALEGLDPRLTYIELATNVGPAAARNAGVRASRGKWLTFLDDDDLFLPQKIEKQMRYTDPLRPQLMVSCRSIYRRGFHDDVWPLRPLGEAEDLADYILRRPSLLGRPGLITLQSLLMHRSVVEQVPFRSHRDHEDWAWLLEAWHRADARIVFAWEPLVIYNVETEGTSRSRRLNWQDSLRWAREYRPWIGDQAFCSFLSTKAALKARRAGNRQGFREIAREVLRSRPGALDLVFLAGVGLLPGALLHAAWKRSLFRNGQTQTAEV